jgi:hypothetical protein
MNYFHINLNRLEDPSALRKKESRELAAFLVPAVLLLVLVVSAAYLDAVLLKKLNHFQHSARDLRSQIESLEKNQNFISEKDVRALSRLESKRVFWTGKLECLAALAGQDVALTELRFSHGKLYIRGIARAQKTENNFTTISSFVERVKAEPAFSRDFKKIEFLSSTRLDFMGQDILNFEFACYQN